MRIKLDENLPTELVDALGRLGHDTDTVPQEGMAGYADDRLWPAVSAASRFFVTQDLDFSDVRRFVPGTRTQPIPSHPGLSQEKPAMTVRNQRLTSEGHP